MLQKTNWIHILAYFSTPDVKGKYFKGSEKKIDVEVEQVIRSRLSLGGKGFFDEAGLGLG